MWREHLHLADLWWAAVVACLLAGSWWHPLLLGVLVTVIPALITSWRRWR